MKLFFVFVLHFIICTSVFAQYIPKNQWSILSVDSEEKNADVKSSGLAQCVIDGNINTFWTTAFKTTYSPFPHQISINFGGLVSISGIEIYPRQKWMAGKIASYELYSSIDGKKWVLVNKGKFIWQNPSDYSTKTITLPKAIKAKYLKIKAFNSAMKSDRCIHLAEIQIIGRYLSPCIIPKVTVSDSLLLKNQSCIFYDSSLVYNTEIIAWEWHFPGGEPSLSRLPNPKIQYKQFGRFGYRLNITAKDGSKRTIANTFFVQCMPAPCISRNNWKVEVSEQELVAGDSARNLYDGDKKTIWHTSWFNGKKLPHYVLIDLGQEFTISAIGYLPRQIGVNGIFQNYAIYVSNDTSNFVTEVARVERNKPYKTQQLSVISPTNARYLKIVIFKTFPLTKNFASASEIFVYGHPVVKSNLALVLIGTSIFLFLLLILILKRKQSSKQSLYPMAEMAGIKTKIQMFGKFKLTSSGNEIRLFNQIRQIFVLITYHTFENGGLTSFDLNKAIWPGLQDDNASGLRSSSIKKLRIALETVPEINIVFTDRKWMLEKNDQVVVDLQVYDNLHHQIHKQLGENKLDQVSLLSFLSIVDKGVFLQDFDVKWADAMKTEVSEEIVVLLKSIIGQFKLQLDSKLKSKIADCMFIHDELNVDALALKLQLYKEDDQLGLANSFYNLFCKKYKLFYNQDFLTPLSSFI